MPSPKSGKAGSAVSPTNPKDALEADNASPGDVEKVKAEQRKNQSGKYGSSKTKAHKGAGDDQDKKKTSWIEIELVDEDKNPVPGERYSITLPDGETVAEGTLDEKGFARVEGIDPGTCQITFPDLDKNAWEKA